MSVLAEHPLFSSRAWRFSLLTSLYFAQGLPYGFFVQALPVLLREQGVSLAHIGLSSLLALPWALKFLWAPLVDRYGSARFGRRRSFIIPLQIASVLCALALAGVDPSALNVILVAVFVVNLMAATQDIATDGLAVETLSSQERGFGNGIQVAAYRIGMVVGGGLLLMFIAELGWALTFEIIAGLLALATLPILFHREAPRPPAQTQLLSWDWLKRQGIGGWLALLVVYKFGDHFGTSMVKPMMVDQGMTLEDVGWLMGTLGSAAGLVGALAGGWITGHLGRRRALVGFGILQVLAVGGYAGVALFPSYALFATATVVEHIISGMATVALFTAMMDACRREHAGTDYTVQASIVVFATGLASAGSGFSAELLGYPAHFALAALSCAGGVALALLVHPPASGEREPH